MPSWLTVSWRLRILSSVYSINRRDGNLTQAPTRRSSLVAVFLSFFVACFALTLRWNALGSIPHGWDSQGYVYQSRVFASGHLTAVADEFEDFFPSPHVVVVEDRKFAIYPPG